MSRAFVKEDDDLQRYREKAEEETQLREWLTLQEKKLAKLQESPGASAIDPEKREQWICSIRADIEKCREKLLEMQS